MSDAEEAAKKLRQEFKTERGIIRNPGKFEGEPIYVPYYWEQFMDGGADDDEGCTLKFNITPEERKAFPELGKKQKVVRIFQNDQGFVSESSRKITRSCDGY